MDFNRPIPPYLIDRKNIIRLILFTALFALVFINIYSPFGSDKWFDFTKLQFFTYSSLVILTGVLVIVISRTIMYFVCRKKIISLFRFLLWVAAEILIMALFYALFEKYVLDDKRTFPYLVKISAAATALVLILPYSVAWLYLSWHDKKEQLKLIVEGLRQVEEEPDIISFFDDKAVLKLSIKKDKLLYLEASENYITVCYLNKGKVSKYLLRSTMKKMEDSMAGKGILRCHRSFMVNSEKVRVLRKDRDGLKLELEGSDERDIPISKTYAENIMKNFAGYSKI